MACVPSVGLIVIYRLSATDAYYATITAVHAGNVVDLVYGGNPPSQHSLTNVAKSLTNVPNTWDCVDDGPCANPHF